MTIHSNKRPPRSKIPVPNSSYLAQTAILTDLTDFFDENIPTISQHAPNISDKPPPYSFAPPKVRKDEKLIFGSRVDQSSSPSVAKKTRKLANLSKCCKRNSSSDVSDNTYDTPLHTKSLENLHSGSSSRESPLSPPATGHLERRRSSSTPNIRDATLAVPPVPVNQEGSGTNVKVVERKATLKRQNTYITDSGSPNANVHLEVQSENVVAENSIIAEGSSPSKLQTVEPAKFDPSDIKAVSTAKVASSKLKPVSPSIADSSKIKVDSPAEDDTLKMKPVSPAITDSSKMRPISPAITDSSKMRPASPAITDSSKMRAASPVITDSSKMKPLSPAVTDSSKMRPVSPAINDSSKMKPVSLAIAGSSKMKPVSPAITDSTRMKPVSPDITDSPNVKPVSPAISDSSKMTTVAPAQIDTSDMKAVSTAKVVSSKMKPVSPGIIDFSNMKPVTPAITDFSKMKSVSPAITDFSNMKPVIPSVSYFSKMKAVSKAKLFFSKKKVDTQAKVDPSDKKDVPPAKVDPSDKKEIPPAKFDPSDKKEVPPAKVDPSKKKEVPPAKVDPSDKKEIPPAKFDPSDKKEVPPAKVDPSKKKEVPPAKVDPSDKKEVPPAKVDISKKKEVPPAKVYPSDKKDVPRANVETSNTKEVPPAKVNPSDKKEVPPAKVIPPKDVDLKPKIDIKAGGGGAEVPQAGGTTGSNSDTKNVPKPIPKKVKFPANQPTAAELAAMDPAKGYKGKVVSSKLKLNPNKVVDKDANDGPEIPVTIALQNQSPLEFAAELEAPTPEEQRIAMDSPEGQSILKLCQTGDWKGVEGLLSDSERAINLGETENVKPLAGISDSETGWTPLMYAVNNNRIRLLDKMIQFGSDLNFRNEESLTALHLAALRGTNEIIRFLVFKKADVSLQTEPKRQNCIHLACSRPSGNSSSILKTLLSVAPRESLLQKDKDGSIPIFVALNSGSRGGCQELIGRLAHEQLRSHSGPNKDTPLHMAVRKKDLELARIFVDAGANVDARNGDHQTPLHIAAQLCDESLVKFFYLCKANPNMLDKEDRTPIHLAAQYGCTPIIDLLADKFKVSVFDRTRDGSTLMHIASLHGHPETAMALFRKGVPLQMPNKGGVRSIHISARYGHAKMISKLLDKGEKVDSPTNDNYTALHIAVECGKPNVVETLLGYGATVHIKGGKAQETPLHIAARTEDGDKCAQMLLKSGADPNITMENGETPLHIASRHGKIRIIKLILHDGAEVTWKSKEGETPLHLACKHGHVRVVKELLQSIKKERGEVELMTFVNTVTKKGESALHYTAKLPNKLQMLSPTMSPTTSLSSANSISLSISSGQNTPTKTTAGKSQPNNNKPKMGNAGKEIAQMLLDGGAEVNLQTKDTHETPFHYCGREGNNLILKEMLSRMTVVDCQRALNRQSTKGWSPLLTACAKGHVDVVRTLIDSNARVDVFDKEGRSGLHLAAEAGYKEICGILLKNKAFINAKSRVGLTALHLAAMKGYTKLCLFLIQEHGAYVDVGTLKKQTPLHMAASTGQLEVCRLLMGLRANPDATDEVGQKPIHMAAENNHADVIKLFLKHQNSLVSSSTKNGSTCAHLAAMQGSISVLEELMKFDKAGVISARNRSTEATALQMAAEGGHAELVKSLLEAGASPMDENKAGYAAVHLAAMNGHTAVLDILRAYKALDLSSRKLGLTAVHIASFYGQQETVRDLLQHISATTPSEAPVSVNASFIKELGTESGLTPLHMGAYSGEENVVRILLNCAGVQVDAPTATYGFNPLHLACRGGHTSVVGLLLSRSSELLESKDASGKTSLHVAAIHGHKQMCEVLIGQGAEIDAIDTELWTPLHCAAQAGHLEVVQLLVESGASPLAKTTKGQSPIWFAAAENHNIVLAYLMKKEHDTYGLMEDFKFVYNLTICGKNCDNEPINEFILGSPAPVDVAAKLSNILVKVSSKEKERAKDLLAASKYCEEMATELLALAAMAESPGRVLQAVDRKGTEFLDVLIENEQKEVVAHTVVQRYLQELWVGGLEWADWKLLVMFFSCVSIPPFWVWVSLPLGHKYYTIPIVKFMSYLTSHIHLMILLCLMCVTPIVAVLPIRQNLFPYWFEWIFLAWMLGLIVAEITNPSDKGGLGWIKVPVIVFNVLGVLIHGIGFFIDKDEYGLLLYIRNQMFGMAVLLAAVQILDFLSFHYLFGPWAIIIGNLMQDLAKFLAVLAIFMLGFSFVMSSLNLPVFERPPGVPIKPRLTNGLPSGVLVTPLDAIELLFFALFGLSAATDMKIETGQPEWTLILFKIFFGIYMLVSVVVLINLLIAMMSDTYQRIAEQSDIEWKYGLAKLIRSMHRTSATPAPINLFTSWLMWIYKKCTTRRAPMSNPLRWDKGGAQQQQQKQHAPTKNLFSFGIQKPTAKQRWHNVFKKAQMTPRVSEIIRLSVHRQQSPMSQGSPLHGLGSTMSMGAQSRIENITDWPLIAKKYRALVGIDEPVDPSDAAQEVIIQGSLMSLNK